jgi:hypothetical protein
MLTQHLLRSHCADLQLCQGYINNLQVDREALPAMETASNGGTGDYVAPANPTEEAVQAAWETVLKISPVSVTANYFQVGVYVHVHCSADRAWHSCTLALYDHHDTHYHSILACSLAATHSELLQLFHPFVQLLVRGWKLAGSMRARPSGVCQAATDHMQQLLHASVAAENTIPNLVIVRRICGSSVWRGS